MKQKTYKLYSPGHERNRQGITLTKIKKQMKADPSLRKQYRLTGMLGKSIK